MKTIALIIVALHFLIAGWHGLMHQLMPVPLSTVQTAFVVIVIVIAPLVGAGLLYSRHVTVGAWLIFASMLGALIFGVVNHFVIVSPDNLWCLAPSPWQKSFAVSATLVGVLEVAGTIFGGALLWQQLSQRSTHSS